MATVSQSLLSHSCANADSLGNPASTGQNPPRPPRHPAESARPALQHPDAGGALLRGLNEDPAPHTTRWKPGRRTPWSWQCSTNARQGIERADLAGTRQSGKQRIARRRRSERRSPGWRGRMLSTIQGLGSAGPDRFRLRLHRATISFCQLVRSGLDSHHQESGERSPGEQRRGQPSTWIWKSLDRLADGTGRNCRVRAVRMRPVREKAKARLKSAALCLKTGT